MTSASDDAPEGAGDSRLDGIREAVRQDPGGCLIALDVDGTLAPIVTRPEDAQALPGAAEAVRRLGARGVRVVLITGRPAAEAVKLVGLEPGDPVSVLGHYGMQRWRAGRLQSPPVAPGVERARRELPRLLADAPDGVHVEDKEHSLVVHTRPASDPAAAMAALQPALNELAESVGLELVEGRAVLELRPPGIDKGSALREAAGEARCIVYVGDDVADLMAYDALHGLADSGARTLAVASVDPQLADHDPRVADAADVALPGPSAVVAWLEKLAAA